MATTANVFQATLDQGLSGNINYPTDSIKMALLTSSASPSLSTWVHYSDLTNEVAAGNGYSTGGVALAGKTHVQTAANSWGTTYATTTAYAAGNIVIPSSPNGFLYQCVVAGTTGGSGPVFPTIVGESVTDSGGVVWSNLGESVTVWSSTGSSWTVPAAGTLSFQYAVIYDAQSGTASTEPLICLINFGTTQSFAAPAGGSLIGTINPFVIGLTGSVAGWFATSPA